MTRHEVPVFHVRARQEPSVKFMDDGLVACCVFYSRNFV
jgi:hypothetical protein